MRIDCHHLLEKESVSNYGKFKCTYFSEIFLKDYKCKYTKIYVDQHLLGPEKLEHHSKIITFLHIHSKKY